MDRIKKEITKLIYCCIFFLVVLTIFIIVKYNIMIYTFMILSIIIIISIIERINLLKKYINAQLIKPIHNIIDFNKNDNYIIKRNIYVMCYINLQALEAKILEVKPKDRIPNICVEKKYLKVAELAYYNNIDDFINMFNAKIFKYEK